VQSIHEPKREVPTRTVDSILAKNWSSQFELFLQRFDLGEG